MFYEVVNPSDKITFEADNDLVAGLMSLLLGDGRFGCINQDEKLILGIWLIDAEGNYNAWLESHGYSLDSLQAAIDANVDALIRAFASLLVCSFDKRTSLVAELADNDDIAEACRTHNEKHRTSMNNICGYGLEYVVSLREHRETLKNT